LIFLLRPCISELFDCMVGKK